MPMCESVFLLGSLLPLQWPLSLSLPVLAIAWLSPWMFWGLGLGAIPVVLHWLHRRRYRIEPWAAMQFLLAAARKNSRRLRIEQWLLLAVRVALLTLLALAFARPTGDRLLSSATTRPPVHRLLVVDTTLSMGAVSSSGDSAWTRLQRRLEQHLFQSRPGDSWQLIQIATSPPAVRIRRPAFEPDAVRQELAQLGPTDEAGDPAAALRSVEELLAAAPRESSVEIIFAGDQQRATWSLGAAGTEAAFSTILQQLSRRARLIWIDAGEELNDNAAITQLSVVTSPAMTGQPLRVSTELMNFGPARPQQVVELWVDERPFDTRTLDFPAGQPLRLEWTLPPQSAGSHRIEARLPRDSLLADNRRWLVLPVREAVRLLLVDGKPGAQPFAGATDFLQLALNPQQDRQGYQVRVIRDPDLARTDLMLEDVVFLCNVASVTESEAAQLHRFVDQGGTLVISVGDQVSVTDYNRTLLARDRELLPAKLGKTMGQASGLDQSTGLTDVFEFDTSGITAANPALHPILQVFAGNPGTGLELTKTFAYLQATPLPEQPVDVILKFSNGDPVVLSRGVGRGQTFLITTALDRSWGTWAVWGHSLVPMLHELVRFAITSQEAGRVVTAGEPLFVPAAGRAASPVLTLLRPDGTSELITGREDGSVFYPATSQAGWYRWTWSPPVQRVDWTAVNPQIRESDLSRLSATELEDELVGPTRALLLGVSDPWPDAAVDDSLKPLLTANGNQPGVANAATSGQPAMPSLLDQGPSQSDFSRWLLWAMLGLAVLEPLLAWRTSFGAIALVIWCCYWTQFVLSPWSVVVAWLAVLCWLAAAAYGFRQLGWWPKRLAW